MENNSVNSNFSSGGSSILDKIILSKEDKARQEFNPQEIVSNLLKKLQSKEAEVLKSRFGLDGVAQETLEAIGKRYGVTRERIRQIENLAIEKIKQDPNFNEVIRPVEHVLTAFLNEYGGIMRESYLLEQLLLTGTKAEADVRAVLFILEKLLKNYFVRLPASKTHNLCWRSLFTDMSFIEGAIQEVIKIIEAAKQPLTLDKIMQALQATDFYQAHRTQLNEKIISACLGVMTVIDKNPFEEYGLSEWGLVKPKRMNDKIKLLLQKEKKPMHFVEIAEKITQVFKKRAYPPTVHNELILNPEYVLVGRGIYALKEWGYKQGVVVDIIAEVLKNNAHPLTRDEIVRQVSEQRLVKKNTIHLALTQKQRFAKLADGRYTLVNKVPSV